MRVAFRADASAHIGSGHLMRCLTLAAVAHGHGHQCVFLSRVLPAGLQALLEHEGLEMEQLPGPPPAGPPEQPLPDWEREAAWLRERFAASHFDWLVCDHYGLDHRWEEAVAPLARHQMVVDDLANRRHGCHVLLDQNLFPGASERYRALVPEGCRQLLGPRYALLRPEFAPARAEASVRAHGVRRLLVFLGGADPDGVTERVLDAVERAVAGEVQCDVVVGAANARQGDLAQRVARMPNARLHVNAANMAELMLRADLGVFAAGSATWERNAVGLPAILVAIAGNQVPIARAVADAGSALYLGPASQVADTEIAAALAALVDSPRQLERMSECAFSMNDADGAQRVLDVLETHP